jgi:glyoxylase-like metal-dependent hydrolase (beta-lactamase superfamily II)
MSAWTYTRGLHDLGNHVYAYLQPDGGWGWSNAGLIVDGEASLLVDTLFDLALTQQMLDAMRDASPAAEQIGTVINTHADGDHCYGNQLVQGAKIVASRRTAEEMATLPPQAMAGLMAQTPQFGGVGEYLQHIFGPFAFESITFVPPDTTFDGELALKVGDREVQLIEVGPAHTLGDTLVYVPADRVIFSGDILFNGGHPIMWAGPVGNWIRACDRILRLEVDTVVPGHGPITDKHSVEEMKAYWEYLSREARSRFDAGLSPLEAAHDISFADYAAWGDAERIVANISALYREFRGDTFHPDVVAIMTQMAVLAGYPVSPPQPSGPHVVS